MWVSLGGLRQEWYFCLLSAIDPELFRDVCPPVVGGAASFSRGQFTADCDFGFLLGLQSSSHKPLAGTKMQSSAQPRPGPLLSPLLRQEFQGQFQAQSDIDIRPLLLQPHYLWVAFDAVEVPPRAPSRAGG